LEVETCEPGGRWCKVLLALTIISAVAGVICALDALGLLPHCRTKPQTVVIIVNDIKALAAEPQHDRIIEEEPAARL
jgi:hypothetical protein